MSGRKFCKSSFKLSLAAGHVVTKKNLCVLCTLFHITKAFRFFFSDFFHKSSSLEHRAFVWCRMYYYSSRENTTKKEGERETRNRRSNGMTCR